MNSGFPNPMMAPLKSLAAGTSSTLYAALDPSLKGKIPIVCSVLYEAKQIAASDSGSYIADATITVTPDYAHNPAIAEKLWVLSEDVIGEKFNL